MYVFKNRPARRQGDSQYDYLLFDFEAL